MTQSGPDFPSGRILCGAGAVSWGGRGGRCRSPWRRGLFHGNRAPPQRAHSAPPPASPGGRAPVIPVEPTPGRRPIPWGAAAFSGCCIPCRRERRCPWCFFRPGRSGRCGPWSSILPPRQRRSNGTDPWRTAASTTGRPAGPWLSVAPGESRIRRSPPRRVRSLSLDYPHPVFGPSPRGRFPCPSPRCAAANLSSRIFEAPGCPGSSSSAPGRRASGRPGSPASAPCPPGPPVRSVSALLLPFR